MRNATVTLHPPEAVAPLAGGWSMATAWDFHAATTTWRLTRGDAVRYLKVQVADHYPTLKAEAERMEWAQGRIPVPRVLDYGTGVGTRVTEPGRRRGEGAQVPGADDDPGPGAYPAGPPEEGEPTRVEWLLTEGLPGVNGVHPSVRRDPRRLVEGLARGLAMIHALPPAECPFDFRIPSALAHARQRVEAGLVRPYHLHDEFAHLNPVTALAELEASVPEGEAPVVCHGDYCTPNVLLDPGDPGGRAAGPGPLPSFEAVGFVDLAELGVADPWWDLAAATWSIGWNLGPEWSGEFLEAYGVEPDPARLRWYRLLYDLAS